MQTGAFTSYIDVAQIALYLFWFFFAGLIYYLRQEDKREGYSACRIASAHVTVQGFRHADPKTFLLPHGGTQTAPRVEAPEPFPAARPVGASPAHA
jgi:photosynthetic reaction center H subunit